MTDVRNGDPQAITATVRFAINGIVEIACRFIVNGDQREVANVGAALAVSGGNALRQLRRVRLNLAPELVGQLVLAKRNLDLHARVGVIAENLDDSPDRLRVPAWLFDNFSHHDLARLRAPSRLCRYQQVLADAPLLRHDDTDPALLKVASDHGLIGALQNFDDGGLA